jgi:hypothetical protein
LRRLDGGSQITVDAVPDLVADASAVSAPARLMSAPCSALWIFLVTLKKSGLPWIGRQSALMPRLRADSVGDDNISATPPP